MHYGILIVLLALLLSACGPSVQVSDGTEPTLALETCRLRAPAAVEQIAAECATLMVPTDYAQPNSATIELALARIPAIGRTSAADPLVLLAGGPGQAAIESFVPFLNQLSGINQTRDILLVDQRGTGRSTPLQCALESLPDDNSDAAYTAWVQDCLDRQPVDPRFFTTEAAARDLDAVRAALGYDQLNLLGVSYGTRLAMVYADLFPDRVRTLVLDGVVSAQDAIGATMSRDAQRALDRLFARCAADDACAAAFPDLPTRFANLLDELEANPVQVTLSDPFTGVETMVMLDRTLAAVTVQTLSYAPETSALLPLLIDTAAHGDLRPLAAQSLLVQQNLAETIALGLRFSVICGEDAPFYPPAAELGEGYLGSTMAEALAAPCAIWPHTDAGSDEREPITSAVPTLLLSGENDPVTPPANGERVAETFPNSRHIVAPGQGHNVFFRGCLLNLTTEFIETADPAALDTSCVERLAAPPFFLRFTGP